MLSPARLYFLKFHNLPKKHHQLGPSVQICEPVGAYFSFKLAQREHKISFEHGSMDRSHASSMADMPLPSIT